MPEILKEEMWVKDIKDIATTVKNADPKKNKELEQIRTVTISDGCTKILITDTPEALSGFTLGGIKVSFTTSQTTMENFDKDEEKEEIDGGGQGGLI